MFHLSLRALCSITAAAAKSLQSCLTLRPHRRQPTRLPRPWDSPGKNTGVGCHFVIQRMKVRSESEVTRSCWTLSDPMDCSPPGSTIHGIFQARVLEWVPLPSPCNITTVRKQLKIQVLPMRPTCRASHTLVFSRISHSKRQPWRRSPSLQKLLKSAWITFNHQVTHYPFKAILF